MGYRHDREDLLRAAVEVAHAHGLGGLTYGAVARRLGIADRTVVYYFASKDELVLAVLERTTASLQDLLAAALGDAPADAPLLLQRAWSALGTPAADPASRVYLECLGLAARGREPYRTAAAQLFQTWTGWTAARLTGAPATRADRAAGVVATLDGLLLARAVAGAGPAAAAARGLGLTP